MEKNKKEIEEAFSNVFGIDCVSQFNDIKGFITLNPVCPRFLDTRTFDICFRYSERGALCLAIHEIIHFVWFHVWNKHFNDDVLEYDHPHIKWMLSEAVIDTIIRNEKRFYDKFPEEIYNKEYAYEEYYTLKIDGVPILEILNDIYSKTDITGFMEQGYALFVKHEEVIRANRN